MKNVKWEYDVFYLSDNYELIKELNKYGDAGWELVAIKDNRYVFKRQRKLNFSELQH